MDPPSSGALGLPRSERLRSASEFRTVFQRGRREERSSFMALWLAADGPRKVGFAVSRQVRGAVRRNRIRRRLREAFRRHRLALPEGIQVVFIGRAAASSAPFRALVAEMADVVWALAGRVKRGRAGGA